MADKKQQTAWEYASDWYDPDSIHRCLQGGFCCDRSGPPRDVRSREFAEWLTHEYRLAMAKGIEIGKQMAVIDSGETKS